MLWEKVSFLPQTAVKILLRFAGIFWQKYFYTSISSRNSRRHDSTRLDSSQLNSIRFNQTTLWHPRILYFLAVVIQTARFWQFVSNLALIFHTGHRKLKCSHNGKSLACQKWRQFLLLLGLRASKNILQF